MVFSSVTFLCLFLPAVILLHSLLPSIKLKNGLLLIASLLFYAWGEPVWILAMLFTVGVNYACARLIAKTKRKKKRKLYLVLGLVVSFAFLFYFKYALFTLNIFRSLLGSEAVTAGPALPIGISFYTFQVVTYTVDVYRKKTPVQRSFFKLLLYVSFFPQLIAGPIVQYNQVDRALSKRTVSSKGLYKGFLRFIRGLAKKVLLANVFAEALEALPALSSGEMSSLGAWLVAILFSLQLFFDFSGYSDMAIGLGRMCGFRFLDNFNAPYISSSVSEFWRRWHISLGSFFREYVYIPLGGNRVGKGRLVLNLMIVWALTGLWHGASWNFVVWGLYYGLLIVIERLLPKGFLESIPKAIRRLFTLLLVVIGWMLFYYESLPMGIGHIVCLFGIGASVGVDAISLYVLKQYAVFLLLGCFCSLDIKRLTRPLRSWGSGHKGVYELLQGAWGLVLLALSLSYLVGQSFNPFLYFRF